MSLLDCDYSSVSNQLDYLIDSGVKSLHFDLMDGTFVNSISYGPKFVTDTLKRLNIEIDSSAHLMIKGAYKHLEHFSNNSPKRIVVHFEDTQTIKNINSVMNFVEENNIGLGLAINPNTSVVNIGKSLLSVLSEVLIMTVIPGKGGQSLIEDCLDKVVILEDIRKTYNLDFTITIDGGVNDNTISQCATLPINQFVVGSYAWKDLANIKERLETIMKSITIARMDK